MSQASHVTKGHSYNSNIPCPYLNSNAVRVVTLSTLWTHNQLTLSTPAKAATTQTQILFFSELVICWKEDQSAVEILRLVFLVLFAGYVGDTSLMRQSTAVHVLDKVYTNAKIVERAMQMLWSWVALNFFPPLEL